MANRNTAPIPVTGDDRRDIGGAVVRRRFTWAGKDYHNNDTLMAAEVLSMKPNNLRAMQDNGYIRIFPKSVKFTMEDGDSPIQRHLMNLGFGAWNVVEGRKLNDKPLTKQQADAMVAQKDLGTRYVAPQKSAIADFPPMSPNADIQVCVGGLEPPAEVDAPSSVSPGD